MLGRLDEDRSCANSRFFRVVLYANAELSTWLRDTFVLHWSSERPVPKLTIDYGDGRIVETTIAGNSAHYVLDADGRVVDVVPGLMTPKAFRAELADAARLAQAVSRASDDAARNGLILDHHETKLSALLREWTEIATRGVAGPEPTLANAAGRDPTLASAESLTMSKSRVEMPVVRRAKLGPSASSVPVDSELWPQIGTSVLERRGLERSPDEVLDAESRALVRALRPIDWSTGEPLDAAGEATLIAGLQRAIIGDTGIDLTRLRTQVHAAMSMRARSGEGLDFASINEWLYRDVFLTPATDRWLGLATPGVFTGLPRDGVTIAG
jgi:hypothetical protein